MNAAEYTEMLRLRLPEGDAWAPSDQTDGETAFDTILRALALEPERIDVDTIALLEKVIPDNVNTDLTEWETMVGAPAETLTDALRLARVQSLLRARGEVDLATLQDVIRAMAGDTGIKLFNRAYPTNGAGTLAAGCGIGHQPYVWLCELWPNVLSVAPDAFESWTGEMSSGTRYPSPVTRTNTAVPFGVTPGTDAYVDMTAPDAATVYISFWIYLEAGFGNTFTVRFRQRDGATWTASDTRTLTTDTWHRVAYEASVGSGGSNARVYLSCGAVTFQARMAHCVAGVRNTALEARAAVAFPMHTRGRFGVQGEYETLLSHDSWEVGI